MLMLDRLRQMNSGSKLGAARLNYRHLWSLVAGYCSLEALSGTAPNQWSEHFMSRQL